MSEPVKISVCIPVYGVDNYIEQCARSLFEQTMQEGIEFIFVNDCTPDKSIEILKQVLEEYPHRKDQVKILHHDQNKGLVAARDTALQIARGDYIIHCDPDDWVELDMYETMYNEAVKNDADMVYCGAQRHYDDRIIPIPAGTGETPTQHLEEIFRGCFPSLCNHLYRQEIAHSDYSEEVPDHIHYAEDLLRNTAMMLRCRRIACIKESFYHYRYNPVSLSSAMSIPQRHLAFESQLCLDKIVGDRFAEALASRRRWALYLAITCPIISAREWHSLWKDAKRGIWRDTRYNFFRKLIFCAACLNFTVTSFLFRKLKRIQ